MRLLLVVVVVLGVLVNHVVYIVVLECFPCGGVTGYVKPNGWCCVGVVCAQKALYIFIPSLTWSCLATEGRSLNVKLWLPMCS